MDGHFGLLGIEERLGQIGGTLTIESAYGMGSRIVGCIPSSPPTPITEGI
jgi:signal transduction histidine kinase